MGNSKNEQYKLNLARVSSRTKKRFLLSRDINIFSAPPFSGGDGISRNVYSNAVADGLIVDRQLLNGLIPQGEHRARLDFIRQIADDEAASEKARIAAQRARAIQDAMDSLDNDIKDIAKTARGAPGRRVSTARRRDPFARGAGSSNQRRGPQMSRA